MLQTAMRNRESAHDVRAGGAIGDELKRAARRLHDAISVMEGAVSARPRPAAEHQQLTAAHARLRQENADLTRRLTEMRAQHADVSQQVVNLSARLEALISRLARLLEE